MLEHADRVYYVFDINDRHINVYKLTGLIVKALFVFPLSIM